MGFVFKRLLNLEKFPKRRQGVLKKNKIVLISVHLEPTGRYLTVVQRFKVRESWHVCYRRDIIPGYSVTDLIFDPHHTPKLINFCKQRVRPFFQRKQ